MKIQSTSRNPFLKASLPLACVALALTPAAFAADGTWSANTTPLFWRAADTGNWASGIVADGSGSTANFTNNITGDRVVNIDADKTIGNITFGDSDTSSAGSWTIDNNAVSTNNLILAGTTPTITVNALGSGKTARINAIIEGTDGLTKAGSGILILGGANTYSGGTYLTENGRLTLTNSSALGTGTLYLQSTQSSTSSTVLISTGLTIDNAMEMDSTTGREWFEFTSGGDATINGDMTITGGGSNALVINSNKTSGSVIWNGDITGASYAGSVSLRGSTGNGAQTGYFNGVITIGSNLDLNAGAAVKWIVNAAGSNYVATRIQNAATIALGGNNGLDTSARVQWNNNVAGVFDLNGYNGSVAGLDCPTTSSTPTVTNNGAADSILTLAALEADRSFAGKITDGTTNKLSLVMNSAGRTQTLTGSNTYTGNTTISGGVLDVSADGAQLYNSASVVNSVVTVNDGGVLVLNTFGGGSGTTTSLGNLATQTSAGSLVLNGGTVRIVGEDGTARGRAIAIGANGGTIEVASGSFYNYNGNPAYDNSYADNSTLTLAAAAGASGKMGKPITGSGVSVAKSGDGTWTLSGTNNYTGTTLVDEGTLLINGNNSSATGNVTVASGAILGGSGTVGGATTIESGGHLAVGNSPGTQTFDSTLTFNSGSIFDWELNADTTDTGSSNQGAYDKVVANNTVSGTSVFTIALGTNFITDAFWDTNKSWTDIFTGMGSFDLSTLFTTFNGTGIASNGLVAGEGQFSFTSNTLNWTAVPEPTSALAGLLLAAGLLRRNRR